MARFLFASQPLTGHVRPALPIVRALASRGHEVRWYVGERFRADVEAAGAAFEPYGEAYDYDDSDLDGAFPARRRMRGGLRQVRFDAMNLFVRQLSRQHEDLSAILARWPAHALVADSTTAAALTITELGGPPAAVYNTTCLGLPGDGLAPYGLAMAPSRTAPGRLRHRALGWLAPRLVYRTVSAELAVQCRRVGVQPRRFEPQLLSPYLFIQPTTEGFEYPRGDLPPQVHFVGPLLPDPPPRFFAPTWWAQAQTRRRPLVLVTQGTVDTDVRELIRPTVRALADEDVLVVAAGVPDFERSRLEPLPANAHVEPFVAFGPLMELVDLFVTNGGFTGVQQALAHGVPVIVAGASADQPEVAGRVAFSGAGINLKRLAPSPRLVAQAVRRVLRDESYRARARELASESARHDAPAEAADLLERLADSAQPVLRG